MTGIILFIIYVITQSTDACALYKESKFDYNITFVNLRLITLRGKHQLVYGIRARSLRPRPHVSGYFLIRNRVDAQSGYFLIWWRNKIEPSSLPTTISTPELFCAWCTGVEIVPTKAEQVTNFARFTTHALFPIFPEESRVLEWILIRVNRQIRFAYGCVWTWKFLNPEKKVVDSRISQHVLTVPRRPRSHPTTETKTSLKKWMLTALNFMTLILSHIIRQVLSNCLTSLPPLHCQLVSFWGYADQNSRTQNCR